MHVRHRMLRCYDVVRARRTTSIYDVVRAPRTTSCATSVLYDVVRLRYNTMSYVWRTTSSARIQMGLYTGMLKNLKAPLQRSNLEHGTARFKFLKILPTQLRNALVPTGHLVHSTYQFVMVPCTCAYILVCTMFTKIFLRILFCLVWLGETIMCVRGMYAVVLQH